MSKAPTVIEIGLFTRGKLLGQGTFANTYRVDVGDQKAALKHLRSDAPVGGKQRFQNEIWALKLLNHSNIPRFIEEGEHEERPYVVMTLAPGKSLRKRLAEPVGDRGPFGERWVLRIVVSVLSAVCEAQDKGITHRDIKDDNVIADDSATHVCLIDFGFCKGADQPADADSFYQVGAPRYSPPSKLRYPSVTHATHDVFAVGVLAYLLLTNTYPWSVTPDQDHGFLAALMESSNPPEVTDLNSVVSYETAGFIRALIAVEDNRRPSAAEALKRAEQLLSDSHNENLRYPSLYRETFPKVSRDPIHGDIRLTESEAELLDHFPFQRLRLVKQLGFSNLVYLGAQHTRLAHSIGTMHVADKMAQAIVDGTGAKIDPEERLLIRLYALIHDIMHMPYGHTIEDELGFFERHDDNSARLDRMLTNFPEFARALEGCSHGRTVLQGLRSGGSLPALSLARDVVDGHTGADVLDYIDRDAYYCGVDHKVDSAIFRQYTVAPVGGVSTEPEKHLVSKVYGSLGLRTDASFAIESLLLQRFALFMKIYSHPAKLSAGAMLGKALQAVIANSDPALVEQTIEGMGDDELLLWLASEGRSSQARLLSKRLLGRSLFKPVYIAEPVPTDDRNYNGYATAQQQRTFLKLSSPSLRAEAERAIALGAGVKEEDVIVYWPENAPGLQTVRHYVQEAPGQAPSRPKSAVSSRMIERHLSIWKIYVFVDPDMPSEKRKNVAIAAHSFIGFQNIMPVT